MSYLVLDIETIGKPWDEFDKKSKEIFRDWAERSASTDEALERELKNIKEGLPLSPFMGEIVSIALLDNDDKGAVYFQAPEEEITDYEKDGAQYRTGTESEILNMFWEVARHYNVFVTFNGRGFDAPYLMIRSAINKIKPTRNLMSNRYLNLQRDVQHIDLGDLFTFYGAVRNMPKLHFAAQAFGIESPKQNGIDGKDVPKAFVQKRYREIAQYNMADVAATKKLYEYWNKYLNL
jgi:DNA polymerase elongation subunit (family B)